MLKFMLLAANVLAYVRHPRLVKKYYRRFRRLPNVCNPRSRTEKMLWRKIFDRNPLYGLMVDKLAVRELVRVRCPGLAMSEILWIGTDAAQIPDALIRPGVVIKTNNGSHRNIFVTEAPTPRRPIEQSVAKWLARFYGVAWGEWAYRRIQPFVFIEKNVGPDIVDLCCHVEMGKCLALVALTNVKTVNVQWAFFDPDGNRRTAEVVDAGRKRPVANLAADFRLPACFVDAVRHAEALGRDCDYLRVDFMSAGGNLFFCEATVFPGSGWDIQPRHIEADIAAAWDLRNAWFMKQRNTGLRGTYAWLYRSWLDLTVPAASHQRAGEAGSPAR